MKIRHIKTLSAIIVIIAIISNCYAHNNIKSAENSSEILRFSQYVKKIDEFTFFSADNKKMQGHGIYTLNSESNAKYLLKKADRRQAYADLISSFILRKIISDRAPLNYILCDNNGKIIGIASRLIGNFSSIYDHIQNSSIISNPAFLKKANEFRWLLVL